jgi:hypothetical protein
VRLALVASGYDAPVATGGPEGRRALRGDIPDAAVADGRKPDWDGRPGQRLLDGRHGSPPARFRLYVFDGRRQGGDRKLNDAWAVAGLSNTPLAHHLRVDFETVEEAINLVDPFYGQLQGGELSREEVHNMPAHQNNVANELSFGLRARKPYGGGEDG